MNSQVEIFASAEFGKLRTINENGKVMFVASDVAKMLGYSNTRKAISDHCPHVTKRYIGVQTGVKADGTPAMQNVQASIITEGDVYRLIAHSKLPAAERFESWVFDEVLPSIRKNGGYIAGQDTLSDDELMAKALMVAQRTIESKNKQITEMKPKADFYDTVVSTESLLSMGDTAKLLDKNVGRNRLYKILREKKILMSDNIPYQQYVDRGYFKVVENYYMAGDNKVITKTTYVKQKGVDYIRKLLKEMENKQSA